MIFAVMYSECAIDTFADRGIIALADSTSSRRAPGSGNEPVNGSRASESAEESEGRGAQRVVSSVEEQLAPPLESAP